MQYVCVCMCLYLPRLEKRTYNFKDKNLGDGSQLT